MVILRYAISGLLLSDLPVLVFVFSPRREVVVAMLKPHTDFGWHGHDDMSNAEKTTLIRIHSFASAKSFMGKLDADDDGIMSLEEAKVAGFSDEQCKTMDTDNDGQVALEEMTQIASLASRVAGGDDGITDGETKATVLQIHDAAREEEGGGVEMIHYDNPMGTVPTPSLVTLAGTSTPTGGGGKEGKEDAGLSLEGHDSSIITRMQATQRMKQAQRQHEDEHGIHV